MFKEFLKRPTLGQIIALAMLFALLIFFLRGVGITTMLVIIAIALVLGLILVPLSDVKEYDKEDLIDWDIVNHPSDKDD